MFVIRVYLRLGADVRVLSSLHANVSRQLLHLKGAICTLHPTSRQESTTMLLWCLQLFVGVGEGV